MIVDFLTSSYETKAIDQNSSQLINWYLVQEESNGRYQVVAYPTPGLIAFNSDSGSQVRGLWEHGGLLYAVVDNKFYSYASNGTRTERGTLTTSTGQVIFTSLLDEILLVDGTNGYHYTVSTTTFTSPIADADFPQTATSIASLDEFAIATVKDTNSFQISSNGDGTNWDALDTAICSSNPDNIVRVIENNRELWFFGENSTEIWYNSGDAFPFERIQGTYLEYGLAARNSVAKGGDNLFLLGKNSRGGIQVLSVSGYQVEIISNEALNYQINSYTTTSDAIGFVYNQEGHEFYVLTFPTELKTWVYDNKTKLWHQRQSYIGSSYTRWLANCSIYCYGKHLVGDYQSGKIYQLSNSTYTENGTAIRRILKTHPFSYEEKRYIINKFQVVFESAVGTNPTFDFEISRDGGRTFSTPVSTSLGSSTDYGKRLIFNRLGQCRNCVFRVTTTMTDKPIILGAQATFTLCNE